MEIVRVLPDELVVGVLSFLGSVAIYKDGSMTYTKEHDDLAEKGLIELFIYGTYQIQDVWIPKFRELVSIVYMPGSRVVCGGKMRRIFQYSKFNGDLSKWDVSNVDCMYRSFEGSYFNNDSIKDWDVSNVLDMRFAFYGSCFNQDISRWSLRNVKDVGKMFAESKFNHDISCWVLSFPTYTMFKGSAYTHPPPTVIIDYAITVPYIRNPPPVHRRRLGRRQPNDESCAIL